jgi:hypothetical protein
MCVRACIYVMCACVCTAYCHPYTYRHTKYLLMHACKKSNARQRAWTASMHVYIHVCMECGGRPSLQRWFMHTSWKCSVNLHIHTWVYRHLMIQSYRRAGMQAYPHAYMHAYTQKLHGTYIHLHPWIHVSHKTKHPYMHDAAFAYMHTSTKNNCKQMHICMYLHAFRRMVFHTSTLCGIICRSMNLRVNISVYWTNLSMMHASVRLLVCAIYVFLPMCRTHRGTGNLWHSWHPLAIPSRFNYFYKKKTLYWCDSTVGWMPDTKNEGQ